MEQKLWHKKWPKDQPWVLDYPDVSVDIFLRTAATKYPDLTAIIFNDSKYTFNEIYESAQRFAAALANCGIGKSDVVALHLTNCPQFAIAYYGIIMSGATFSPANPLLSVRELTHQLNDCGAKAVLTYDEFIDNILAVKDDTKIENVFVTSDSEAIEKKPIDARKWGNGVKSFLGTLDEHAPNPPKIEIQPDKDLAHLAYTGGTTGLSKGVMLTHKNVVAAVLQTVLWEMSGKPVVKDGILFYEDMFKNPKDGPWEFIQDEGKGITINVVPWYHAMGTIQNLNNMMARVYTIILHKRFEPNTYLDAVEKYKATYISGAPPMFMSFLTVKDIEKRDLSSVKRLISGAAPLAVEAIGKLQKIFPNVVLVEAYGLTEVVMGALYNPSNRSGVRKIGSVGIPLYDTEIKIMGLGDEDKEAPIGEPGEIWLKGPQVMQGYYNRQDETKNVLRDGWLSTGDMGIMDEDGYVTIVDRKKDMLIYKGYNVYPRELEEILYQHPAVLSCTVIGIYDPSVGDLPKAFVVKKKEVEVAERELMEFVNKQVTPYKKLRELEFRDSIPVSATGKILKRELRAQEEEKRKAHNN